MESYVKNVNIPHPSSDGTSILVHLQNPSVTSAPRQQYASDSESHPRQRSSDDRAESTNSDPSTETNNTQSEPANHDGQATATQGTSNARTSSQNFSGSTSNQETGANTQQTESPAVIPSTTTTQSTTSDITDLEGANRANSSSPAENSAGNGAAEPSPEASSNYDWDAGNGTPGSSSATISTDEGMHLANEFSSDSQSDSNQESDQREDSSDNQSTGNNKASRDGQDETLRDDDIETPEDYGNKSLTDDNNETPSNNDNETFSPNSKNIRISSAMRLRKSVNGKASENQSRSSGNDISSFVGKKWEKLDASKSHESERES